MDVPSVASVASTSINYCLKRIHNIPGKRSGPETVYHGSILVSSAHCFGSVAAEKGVYVPRPCNELLTYHVLVMNSLRTTSM